MPHFLHLQNGNNNRIYPHPVIVQYLVPRKYNLSVYFLILLVIFLGLSFLFENLA